MRFIREITFNLTAAEADSEMFTRVALFAVKENVLNFNDGMVSMQNIEFIQNFRKESYFSLKLRYLIIKLMPAIILKEINITYLEPIPKTATEIGFLERNFNFLNTEKFNAKNPKFRKGLQTNEKNNFLSLFYLNFEQVFQKEDFFLSLLKNQMYYECFNLLESKLGKIKDAEATLNNLNNISYNYDKQQILLIKIYIYCYIKIEFLETGKIINLNLGYTNIIGSDIAEALYDSENEKSDCLLHHFSKFLENFNYEKNGNMISLYKLFIKSKEDFKKFIEYEQENYALKEREEVYINFEIKNNNIGDEKNKCRISLGNFCWFISEMLYHFSCLLSNIRALYCRIEEYKNKEDTKINNDNIDLIDDLKINNREKSAAEKNNKNKSNLEIIKEQENENNENDNLILNTTLNIQIQIMDSLYSKEFQEIQESVKHVMKYSEYFEKFIFSAFYLNKTPKRQITETDSFFEFEEGMLKLIPEKENILNLSLNEILFFKFNSMNFLFKEFIEENFVAFVFAEIAKKNPAEEETAQCIVNYTRFCHTQKFEINNSAKKEMILSTQKIQSKKLNANLNQDNINKNGSRNKIIDKNYEKESSLIAANKFKNNLSNENQQINCKGRKIDESNLNEKNLLKVNFNKKCENNSKYNDVMDLDNDNGNNGNPLLNNTYSYAPTSITSLNFEKLNLSIHENEYGKIKNLDELDFKIQEFFTDFLTNKKQESEGSESNSKNAYYNTNSKNRMDVCSKQKPEKPNNNKNNNSVSALEKALEIKEIKSEDVFMLNIARCIMNATKNIDLEIKILIAITKNYIEERKSYAVIETHTLKLFDLFLKRYLSIEKKPENFDEFDKLVATKKANYQMFFNKDINYQNNAKKNSYISIPGLLNVEKNNNESFKSAKKFISSEIYLEILEIFKVLFSNYSDSKNGSVFKKNILLTYEQLEEFFDDSVSKNIIKFRIIEINNKITKNRNLDKHIGELIDIMNKINWQKQGIPNNGESSFYKNYNNDFLEANKILFELEFSKSKSNIDAQTLDRSLVDSFINLDLGTLLNLIIGIEKISLSDEYQLKSMLSIFLNSFYMRSIQNSKECERIYDRIECKLSNEQIIEKFNLVKDSLLIFSTKIDPERINKFFVMFLIKVLSGIIQLKPMESVFGFTSLLVKVESAKLRDYTNKNNNNVFDKLRNKENIIEYNSTINNQNCEFSLFSSKIISQIFQKLLNNNNNNNIYNNIYYNNNTLNNSNNNNQFLISNKEINAKSNPVSLLIKKPQITSSQSNGTNLIFKTSIIQILELESALGKIKTSIENFFESFKIKNSDFREKLKFDYFEAEKSKKNFKTKAIQESIKDQINCLNKFLQKEEVKIPMPNFSNFKKPSSEILYVKSMSFLSFEDIFRSKDIPIKITLWSQEVLNVETNKPKKLKFTYVMKKAVDVIKEYKTAQIFLSIQSMLNFHQNKIEKEIIENFKCYEIVALGDSIILIEFIQSSNTLKKKLEFTKEQFLLDYINQDREIELLTHKQTSVRDNLFRHYPRNLLQASFYAEFPNALEWYRMRKRFALSYAVWSMCSYVVKLGDRHLDNIMINDLNQLIFIDYGYVVNDGFNLGVPEIVPIRFTSNLRYALGFLEESGVFFNACFKVLEAIYKHSFVVFPQMKAILDNIREKAQMEDKISYDEYPNWMSIENMGKDSRSYLNNLNTLVDFMKESKMKKDVDIQKVIRDCLGNSCDYSNLSKMFYGWTPHV